MRMHIAGILTVLWLAAVAALVYAEWASLENLAVEDIATILGAVVTPLAFLWFIVGYFQHGDVLRQNGEALRVQANQLELQVQGTRALALTAVRQAETMLRLIQMERKKHQEDINNRMRAAQPQFVLEEGMRHPRAGTIRLQNVGAPASNLAVVTGAPSIRATIHPAAYVHSGGTVNIELDAPDFALIQAQVEYSDALGFRRRVALNWMGDEVEIGTPNLEETV